MKHMLLKVAGLDDASLLRWGKLSALILVVGGIVLMSVSMVAILRYMPMAKEFQQITLKLTHDIRAENSVATHPLCQRANGLLNSYAELPPMFIGYLSGLGFFLGFTIMYTGALHWRIRAILNNIPQQSGAGYPPQGVGSPDP